MEIKILGNNHSILDQYLAEIRDETIQKDPLRFRENMYRIGEIFAYEISKSLEFKVNEVTTPLGTARVPQLISQPVLATILRAGLSMHNGLLKIFDRAENCFISAYRKYTDKGGFEIEFEYMASPSLDDKVVILSDPMLASGKSMEIAYKLDDKLTIAEVYKIKGIIQRNKNNLSAAENCLLTSLRLNCETGNKLNQAETSYELGILYNLTDDKEKSKKYFADSLEYYKMIEAEEEIREIEKLIKK